MVLTLLIPNWLVDEHAVTLATWGLVFATLLLVGATAFLYFDSRGKGSEQRERWRIEDKQRADDRNELRERWAREDLDRKEEMEPKYALGIDLDEQGPYFWISNMGVTAFLVKTIFVNRTQIGTTQKVALPTKWNEPVPVGSKKIYRLEVGMFPRIPHSDSNAVYECQTSCSIISASGRDVFSSKREFVMYTDKDGARFKTEAADY